MSCVCVVASGKRGIESDVSDNVIETKVKMTSVSKPCSDGQGNDASVEAMQCRQC